MLLSVVVTCYQDSHSLDLVLAGFARQTWQKFDLHVVNDGGARELSDVADKYQGQLDIYYHYLEPQTSKFRLAAARNLGIRHCRSDDRILVVDGDCVPARDLVERHVAYGSQDVVICGRRKHVDQRKVESLSVEIEDLEPFVVADDRRFEMDFGVYRAMCRLLRTGQRRFELPHWRAAWGFQQSFPTRRLEQTGGYWERFNVYGGEDQELAWRMRGAGCKLWADFDCLVYHLDHDQRSLETGYRWIIRESQRLGGIQRNGSPLLRRSP